MLKILLHGAGGKMGQALCTLLPEDMCIAAGVDARAKELKPQDYPLYSSLSQVTQTADVLVDFSRPDALPALLDYATSRGIALVLATTGYSNEDLERIRHAARLIPIFQSANMSVGVNLLMQLTARTAAALHPCDTEIIEKHHRMKVDAPSGTALSLAHTIREATAANLPYVHGRTPQSPPRSPGEIGMHAIRGGTIVGEHSVLFILDGEVIELKHSAQSRDVFAHGALRAARFIEGQVPGLYNMKDLLGDGE